MTDPGIHDWQTGLPDRSGYYYVRVRPEGRQYREDQHVVGDWYSPQGGWRIFGQHVEKWAQKREMA